MRILRTLSYAALGLALPAMAAAAPSDALEPDSSAVPAVGGELEVVHMVHNWVLCVTQPSAETMARAQEAGGQTALKAYDDLVQAKACGRLPKFGVVLHKQLYPLIGGGQSTRVFAASVNIGIGWMDAFVVPDELAQGE